MEKLYATIQVQFKKLLAKRLEHPHVPSARLSGTNMKNAYKIKLRDSGYRLAYEVDDNTVMVLVLAVGKWGKSQAYEAARTRK